MERNRNLPPVLLPVAYVVIFIGYFWVAALAWQKGILWGIGCICFPVINLIYVVLNWKESKTPFFIQVAGAVLLVLANGAH